MHDHHSLPTAPAFPAETSLHIYTFGTLQVVRGQAAVTESDWHTRQARQLLKILLTERPRPVSTDYLIELLWPSSTPGAAATTLRSAINALRNVLEPDRPSRMPSRYIVTQAPGYAFHLTPEIWLDVDHFEQKLTQAGHTLDVALRQNLLESAVDLYKDDYLISDPYADWLQAERERLRERYFDALLQLAALFADQGRYPAAIAACRRLLARDEVRENAYQALMRYQAESGDSAGALLTYERCRAILADELGADPSPLTQLWHQRILNGEVLARPVNTAPLPHYVAEVEPYPYAPPVASLPQRTLLPVLDPADTVHFVGRAAELEEMEVRLERALGGSGNLLIIDGEAGVGKTRLAYELLRRAGERGATVISATCQQLEQQLPFASLADSLGRYLYGLPDESVRCLPQSSLTQLAQIVPSLQDRGAGILPPSADAAGVADENRQRLIDGIVSLFAAMATLRPLVLLLDDLQWSDPDTLAVLSRLAQRLGDLPILLLLSYRNDDLSENDALGTLLHAFNRSHAHSLLNLARFTAEQVTEFVALHWQEEAASAPRLGSLLFSATQGNALFVAEALRDLEERHATDPSHPLAELLAAGHGSGNGKLSLRRNQRVQEIILERIARLPDDAHAVLNLCAVIGRDFSLELLETAASGDPLTAIELLLQRRFLLERPDERIDFNHQVVREAVYDTLSIMQRRRLHLAVAGALVKLGRTTFNPAETAFHFSQSGANYRLTAARYSVAAAEKLLKAYGFRQAKEMFDRALEVLESAPEESPDQIRRALQGRGLASEVLFDPEGVTATYRRLLQWARQHGDQRLLFTTYNRLTTVLSLLGQQRESNELLRELLATLASLGDERTRSPLLTDLQARRQLIYGPDGPVAPDAWSYYVVAAPPVADPVKEVLQIFEPVNAVLPLFEYGWTLLVQGELGEATRVLSTVVDLATETGQPSIASAACHQLAVTARILGDLEHSQTLNEQSIAINRTVPGPPAELGSMWPRIASAFLSLHAGRLEEAERRLRRVVDYLGQRPSFANYRDSANTGLGLVALMRGDLAESRRLLAGALADADNLYPYTYVQAMIGLSRIAGIEGALAERDRLLRQALHFAGKRSLLEEYTAVLAEIARVQPTGAPVVALIERLLTYVQSIGLDAATRTLLTALEHVTNRLELGTKPVETGV